jgi:hypothetical protein
MSSLAHEEATVTAGDEVLVTESSITELQEEVERLKTCLEDGENREEARSEGFNARIQGLSISSNPYVVEVLRGEAELADYWHMGHDEASEESAVEGLSAVVEELVDSVDVDDSTPDGYVRVEANLLRVLAAAFEELNQFRR